MVRTAAADHGMVDALAGYGIDIDAAATGRGERRSSACSPICWPPLSGRAPSGPTSVAAEVKALLMVCKSDPGPRTPVSPTGWWRSSSTASRARLNYLALALVEC